MRNPKTAKFTCKQRTKKDTFTFLKTQNSYAYLFMDADISETTQIKYV